MKICPSCRKLNADEAIVCDGCSADLSEAPSSQSGRAVTMFGAQPEPMALDPLERAVETVAGRYGAAMQSAQDAAQSDEEAEEAVFQKIASGASAAPRKPWER